MEQRETPLINVNDANFEGAVLMASTPVLLDFSAAWCGPCRAIAPVIAALADDYADRLTVAKVDVDENPRLAKLYGVRSIPTVMLLNGGEVERVLIGARSQQEYRDLIEASLH
jgi:thioredoxin 1